MAQQRLLEYHQSTQKKTFFFFTSLNILSGKEREKGKYEIQKFTKGLFQNSQPLPNYSKFLPRLILALVINSTGRNNSIR